MPESAIDSGCIDFVLSPEAIAAKIAEIVRSTEVVPARAL
jgi:two-component system chemotaxis response regulator CheB